MVFPRAVVRNGTQQTKPEFEVGLPMSILLLVAKSNELR